MAFRECLRTQEPDFYHNETYTFMPRWYNYINMPRDNAEKIMIILRNN